MQEIFDIVDGRRGYSSFRGNAMNWRPATIDEVERVVQADLSECSPEQIATFRQYSIRPCSAPIVRNGELESVVVVARKSDRVIYWEDVEEGFNVSPIAPDGRILKHLCNQDDLGFALKCLTEPPGS